MRKELRPVHDDVTCDVCGRTILKGERTDRFLDAAAEPKRVCELCTARAAREGWLREAVAGEVPRASRRAEPRRSLWSRFTGPRPERPAEAVPEAPAANGAAPAPAPAAENGSAPAEPPAAEEPAQAPAEERPAQRRFAPSGGASGGTLKERLGGGARRKDSRHVRAVPTDNQVKVQRALELFNDSEHVRTIAGIGRSLGGPWVNARAVETSNSEVIIVVAWELSWYRYRVELGDADQPVLLLEKGEEISQLDEALRDWNAGADAEGRLALAVESAQ